VNDHPSAVGLEEPVPPAAAAPAVRSVPAFGWLLGRAVPNLLVLFALAALAWWGHRTGWKLPRAAQLAGETGEDRKDWCEEHGVPESICVECNEALLPRGKQYGWCKVHGVQECPLEHPDVAQLPSTPRVTPEDFERARRALAFDRPVNNARTTIQRRRIQFASEEAVSRAGIKVTDVYRGPVVEAVAANGEVAYDQNRVANLAVPVPGKVWGVYKEVGRPVRRGEILALVDAGEVGKAKAEFLGALAQVEVRAEAVKRLTPVSGQSVAAAELIKARAELREAEIRLVGAQQALGNLGLSVRAEDYEGLPAREAGGRIQFLGLPEGHGLDPRTTTANLLPVVAPLDGVLVSRSAVPGTQAEANRPLFVVADTSRLWLNLQVRQEDAGLIRGRNWRSPGHLVRFRPAGSEGEIEGRVLLVSTEVDEKTRTVRVLADLDNADASLRANTFGAGRIILREEPKAVVVPSVAVQWEGDCHVVFVRDKDYAGKDAYKVFHTRVVRPGARDGDRTEIIAGVLPGELVVTEGSGLLRSELLKNSLGEG
jgi:cobalt-zinc-cadmium efflux system membrane fusion protein